MYDNKVIGNKSSDNKQASNKQKAKSSTQKGIVPNQKAQYFKAQNSPNHTPEGPTQDGDKGVRMQEKRQKTIVRKNATYSDYAISAAKRQRGAM